MSKEQYVTYKVAKLLREKGFRGDCIAYYNDDGKRYLSLNAELHPIPCPTQAVACRWLWEEKGFYVNAIYGDYPALKKSFWMPQIDSLDGCYGVDDENFFKEYDNPQDCIEAALLYVLQNLI